MFAMQPNSDIEIPLSLNQLDIYGAQQVIGAKPVYNIPVAFKLTGPLDRGCLEGAVAEVVQRHQALRSEIVVQGSEPRQRIRSAESFRMGFHEEATVEKVDGRIRSLLAVPFRPSGELPFRADLIRTASEDHIFLIQLNHLFGDMASVAVILNEVSIFYAARLKGYSDAGLPEPARLESSREPGDSDLKYWKEALKGSSIDFEMPLDCRRPNVPSFNGDVIIREIPERLRAGVAELARRLKCSVYTVLLSAFEALLFRYTGEREFSLAAPFSDRTDPDLADAVGYFSRLLPVPCRVDPEQCFQELVSSVRESCIEAFSHGNVSFREILQTCQASEYRARPAMARIVFQYHPEELQFQLTGVDIEHLYLHSGTSKFDLCVSVGGIVGDGRIEFEFDTDIFHAASIKRFARCYERVLGEIVRDPRATIKALDIIPSEDRALLESWGQTCPASQSPATVHSLFEEQAKRQPDRIAILAEGRSLSYREVNHLADNVAATLTASGVEPNTLVGVCIKRSPELIIALLGILKAGAAFVPLDANHPPARLEYLFDDSGIRVLVCDDYGQAIVPANIKALSINNLMEGKSVKSESTGSAESRAYVMYTSGSTGQPKGVVVPHRAIVRLVKSNNYISVSENDVFLAFAPVSFDASTLEIWTPLLNGATVAVYPSEFESTEQFSDVLTKYGVTVLWLTSALFNTIADQDIQCLREVRQLLVGGDVLSVAHIRKALAALPETQIINGYGPTENTTFTCCYRIPRFWSEERSIPIGRPINGTTVHILDRYLQRVPIGVAGDLYTGGAGLSLGYWKKPELTEASFIPDPFSDVPSARLYRTGDLARFLPDGNIEFLGRKDSQVKIRGFRIELGEVENAFRTFAGVRDVVATVVAGRDSAKSLAVYVIPDREKEVNPSDLLRAARAVLPSPAVPSFVTILNEFPMSPTGKVDRRALPAPEDRGKAAVTESLTSFTPVEERIVDIWRMILGVEQVSVNDSFFDLGGESLRATRAVNQLNKAFDCRLRVSSIFAAPTAREMAELIERQRVAANPITDSESARVGTLKP